MSTQKQSVEIQPKKDFNKEKFFVYNVQCPACNGKGSHTGYTPGKKDPDITPCKQCDATGKLKAEIDIIWTPYYD
ncbi:MAG TPA: hypothetical protein DEQ30_04900 [Porphyromonadaceae bacterium]|nr:hypothetical protein [Porphyromonadaceae bacterium]